MFKHSKKLLALCLLQPLISPLAFAENSKAVEKSVQVKGPQKGAFATILEDTVSKPKTLATCEIPCRKKINTEIPFKVRIVMISNTYGVIIRHQRDAFFDGKTYVIDFSLGTPEEENRKYFKDLLQVKTVSPEYVACETFALSDLTEKARPCYRFPPPMPLKSVRSGVCKIRFYVLPDGSTDGVHAKSCSEPMFETASIEAVKLYRYYPKLSDGKVVKSGVQKTLKFTLKNDKGKIVPALGE